MQGGPQLEEAEGRRMELTRGWRVPTLTHRIASTVSTGGTVHDTVAEDSTCKWQYRDEAEVGRE